jgi:hypothetical protein
MDNNYVDITRNMKYPKDNIAHFIFVPKYFRDTLHPFPAQANTATLDMFLSPPLKGSSEVRNRHKTLLSWIFSETILGG